MDRSSSQWAVGQSRFLRPRTRFDSLLAEVRLARLTTVTAPAGYGKTTLLASWADRTPTAWHTCTDADRAPQRLLTRLASAVREVAAELVVDVPHIHADQDGLDDVTRAHALCAPLCDAAATALRTDVLLVVDDAHVLDGATGSIRLLEALCRQAPPTLHLVIAGRAPVRFPTARLRGSGELVEVTAKQLAFTSDETAGLLGASASAAGTVQVMTGGWPVAVRLAAESLALSDDSAALWTLERPGPLFDYLAHEVFDREPAPVRELIRTAAVLDRFTARLLAALGHRGAAATIADLVDRGLLIAPLRASPGWFTLTPLGRNFARSGLPVDDSAAGVLRERAADWFVQNGQVEAAISALAGNAAHERIERLLAEHADNLLATVGADGVIAAVAHVPDAVRGPGTWQLAGEAYQVAGNWAQARYCLRRAAGDGATLPTPLARRIAWMHYFSGAPAEALSVCTACPMDGGDPREESLLLSCRASAHWALGELDACRASVATAMRLARDHGDDASLATAYTVLAMVAAADGDRVTNAAHYGQALTHAERAGDVLGVVRVRVNRSSHYVEEGRYPEALDELEVALRLAEVTGFATYRALGLINRGEARLGLGQLDEAAADFQAARSIYAGTGSGLTATVLRHLGQVYELRGNRALARTSYEEAIGLAEANNTVTHLQPALAGLARLLAADEPASAETLLRRASACGTGLGYPAVLLATAAVALARADPATARDAAARAERVARDRSDRATLAESLELRGLSDVDDLVRGLGLLDEADAIWRELGNPIGELRVLLARATLLGDAEGIRLAERAEAGARKLGAGALAEQSRAVAERCRRARGKAVHIQTFGGFRVSRAGEPVPAAAWQSRKARDLVKILVARRGRPVTREVLIAALWPEEHADQIGNRLAVAVSTARTVLDPDRRLGAGRCLVAEDDTIRLDTRHVTVDVLDFLGDARAGLASGPENADGLSRLAAAEAAYTGDFLEEDPYEDWAAALRDEARLTYLQVATALAERAVDDGEPVAASRYCLRVLEHDRYDEQAHLTLVRALVADGRHGEARRRYQTYVARMAEIDVEPRPFPPGTTPNSNHTITGRSAG